VNRAVLPDSDTRVGGTQVDTDGLTESDSQKNSRETKGNEREEEEERR
jgi:hypothetical protein